MSRDRTVSLVEVGLRDGLQPIEPFVPTERKIALIQKLYDAGIRRMEATAFVSKNAVPQLVDAAIILEFAQSLPGLDVQVLVPNLRYAEQALAAGARRLAFVLSVSEKHNMNNVRRTPRESVEEYARLADMIPGDIAVRVNIATAFDCPFDGPLPASGTLAMIGELAAIRPDAEICPCDTTGRVTPDLVRTLFDQARSGNRQVTAWAFHGHDTYGLGVANVLAAWEAGVSVVDASVGGLGGCPFAPGATGNVATEDVLWAFDRMGVRSGVDLQQLVSVAHDAAALPGGSPGGRVRAALTAAWTADLCGQRN